jgi:hypothetical protein
MCPVVIIALARTYFAEDPFFNLRPQHEKGVDIKIIPLLST